MANSRKKLVHEGHYVAEVEVALVDSEEAWGPYLTLREVEKLDQVREALRRGDLTAAGRLGRVFHLMPISA
ncbi:MAG: hypothetical protein ABJC13_19800 [Acidobacteriota bacterium]